MAKSIVRKKIVYFIISITVLVIFPLTVKSLIGKKPGNLIKSTAVQELGNKIGQKIVEIKNTASGRLGVDDSKSEEEIGRLIRDPFSTIRRISQSLSTPQGSSKEERNEKSVSDAIATEKDAKNPLEGVELKAVLIDGEKKYALINDRLCLENQSVNGMKIAFIREGEVGLLSDGITLILHMKE